MPHIHDLICPRDIPLGWVAGPLHADVVKCSVIALPSLTFLFFFSLYYFPFLLPSNLIQQRCKRPPLGAKTGYLRSFWISAGQSHRSVLCGLRALCSYLHLCACHPVSIDQQSWSGGLVLFELTFLNTVQARAWHSGAWRHACPGHSSISVLVPLYANYPRDELREGL